MVVRLLFGNVGTITSDPIFAEYSNFPDVVSNGAGSAMSAERPIEAGNAEAIENS